MFFWRKPDLEKFKQWVQLLPEDMGHWQALEFNYRYYKSSEKNIALECHHEKMQQLRLFYKKDHLYSEAALANEMLFSGKVPKASEDLFFENYKTFIHGFMINTREKLITMAKNNSEQDITLHQEAQHLEWWRVSLKVLGEALDHSKKLLQEGEDVLPSGFIFCGHRQPGQNFIFHLRLFNLDIHLLEDRSHGLRVTVLDKKNKESFEGLSPSLQTAFSHSKAQAVDELLKLLPQMGELLALKPALKGK